MILKPLNMLGFVAAALAGLHLYTTKHEAALLDRELRAIARDIDAANERTQALAAEWAWLNEPERLRSVAQRHLSLEPMQPTQFLRLNEAERRIPPVAAYSGPPALFAAREPEVPPGATVTVSLLPQLPPVVQVARAVPVDPPAAEPEAAPDEPAPMADAQPAPPVVLALPVAPPREPAPRAAEAAAAPRAAEPVAAPRHVEPPAARPVDPRGSLADIARASMAPPRPAPAPAAVAAAPRPAPRPVAEAAALPPIAAPRPVVTQVAATRPAMPAVAPPRPAPTQLAAAPRVAEPPAVSLGGSLLGGNRPMLAPPVPFGSANAAALNGGAR